MTQKFKRKIEDFNCGNCGAKVLGNGFTNHCPSCLWSKHVDVFPGDRDADCGGLMEPTGVELEKGKYIVTQKCLKCGKIWRNESSPKDAISQFLADLL
jgi:hypothetical protein